VILPSKKNKTIHVIPILDEIHELLLTYLSYYAIK